jgi:hypothetical protein
MSCQSAIANRISLIWIATITAIVILSMLKISSVIVLKNVDIAGTPGERILAA